MKKSIIVGIIIFIVILAIFVIYFYLTSSKKLSTDYDYFLKNTTDCNTNSDCHIVTTYDYSDPIVETLITCRNKNIPLDNKTEWEKEYSEYTKSTCICDNGNCGFKR